MGATKRSVIILKMKEKSHDVTFNNVKIMLLLIIIQLIVFNSNIV